MIDHQLAANRTEAARLQAVISGYQSKVDIVPTRESELVELTRDYGDDAGRVHQSAGET